MQNSVNDFVYSFTVSEDSMVGVSLVPTGGSTRLAGGIDARSRGSSRASWLLCDCTNSAGGRIDRRLMRVSPGVYCLWIDTYINGSTAYPGPFNGT